MAYCTKLPSMLCIMVLCALLASTIFARFDASSGHLSPTLSNGLSNNLTFAIDTGLPRPEKWNYYAKNGTDYYKAWQSADMTDQPVDWSIIKELEESDQSTYPSSQVEPSVKSVLDELHVSLSGKFLEYLLIWPKDSVLLADDEERGRFACSAGATDGLFIVRDIHRGTMPKGQKFSQIAWWIWQTVVDKSVPAEADGCDPDYSGLKYIFTININNNPTRDLLNYVTQDDRPIYTWNPHDVDTNSNPYWALLGSPLGASAIFLVTEHKASFKGKGVTSISVKKSGGAKNSGDAIFVMWITIGGSSEETVNADRGVAGKLAEL